MTGKFARTRFLSCPIITGVPLLLPVMSLLIVDNLTILPEGKSLLLHSAEAAKESPWLPLQPFDLIKAGYTD